MAGGEEAALDRGFDLVFDLFILFALGGFVGVWRGGGGGGKVNVEVEVEGVFAVAREGADVEGFDAGLDGFGVLF